MYGYAKWMAVFVLLALVVTNSARSGETSKRGDQQSVAENSDRTLSTDDAEQAKTNCCSGENSHLLLAQCVCDRYPFFHISEDYWLWFALQYEECEISADCNDPTPVYNEGGPNTQPETCPDCNLNGLLTVGASELALEKAKPANFGRDDLEDEFADALAKDFPSARIRFDAVHEQAVDFIKQGRIIRARLFLVEFQPSEEKFPTLLAFGVEVERLSGDVLATEKVSNYRDFAHIYTVTPGSISYVVITAK